MNWNAYLWRKIDLTEMSTKKIKEGFPFGGILAPNQIFFFASEQPNVYFIMTYLCLRWSRVIFELQVFKNGWGNSAWFRWVIYCRTCFSMGDLGVQVSLRLFVRPSVCPSTFTMGVWWAQLLLQFFTDLFETLQMFSSWCEDVHVVWI